MCFSVKTSIISYVIGLIAAAFAFGTRQMVLGCLILAYAQMQLSEAFIWRGIDTQNRAMNRAGTNYGKYLLPIHNIAIGAGILLSVWFFSGRGLRFTDFIPLIVGVVFYGCVMLRYRYAKPHPKLTFPKGGEGGADRCQNPGNRLVWPFPHRWYLISYAISVVLFIMYVKPFQSKATMITFFSATLLAAGLIYPTSIGSVWCWSTSFVAPIIVLLNYFIIRNVSGRNLLI